MRRATGMVVLITALQGCSLLPDWGESAQITDRHGCVRSEGYRWSQLMGQCLIPAEQAGLFQGLEMAEIAITSDAVLRVGEVPESAFTLPDAPGVGVVFKTAEGEKCQRCWKVLPEVGKHGHDGLCARCADAVERSAV